MTRLLGRVLGALVCAVAIGCLTAQPASAIPGFPDCKDAPTPDMPGRGMAGFFAGRPDTLPPEEDPFADGAQTTIFEQYGYAGLRWHTYDLGCGPDAMRQPDAVIGTAISNWLVQMPIALTALTGSVTQVAFHPNFLGAFDGAVERVSSALHQKLFASWIPFVIAAVGLMIIFKAAKASLATTAGAIGWALIVVLVATALFRWPVEAGRAADATVTGTLGAVVSRLDGNGSGVDPGTAVASNVSESILYRAWLAGELGSPDSATARKYGPELFKSQALTWREAAILEDDPDRGQEIIEHKQDTWKDVANKIEDEDPEAYEHLTGTRSETRVGYAILSTIGTYLALPFLLMSALLLLGCFLIVRLAVMLFPAFATLGAFPASRGLVIGLGRTVGAAVVNAIIFGVGAGVTIAVLGVLFHPGGGTPAWLGVVLMPLFTVIMWVALKPFRRLTTMVNPNDQHFGRFQKPSWAKRLVMAGVSAASSGAAAGIAAAAVTRQQEEDEKEQAPPERAEAGSSYEVLGDRALPPVADTTPTPRAVASSPAASLGEPTSGPPNGPNDAPPSPDPRGSGASDPSPAPALDPSFVPRPTDGGLEPAESEEFEGEEIYVIYRPSDDEPAASA